MDMRKCTDAFAVVDEAGGRHVVKEYTRSDGTHGAADPKQVEYELSMERLAVTRLNRTDFVVADSNVRLRLY